MTVLGWAVKGNCSFWERARPSEYGLGPYFRICEEGSQETPGGSQFFALSRMQPEGSSGRAKPWQIFQDLAKWRKHHKKPWNRVRGWEEMMRCKAEEEVMGWVFLKVRRSGETRKVLVAIKRDDECQLSGKALDRFERPSEGRIPTALWTCAEFQ